MVQMGYKMTKNIHNESIWVVIQLLLFAIILLLAQMETAWIEEKILRFLFAGIFFLGLIMCLTGVGALNKNLTAFPTPKKDARLQKTGIYRLIRHPMYSGIMLCVPSYALLSGNMAMLVMSVIVMIFFAKKAQNEETKLVKIYSDYSEYQQKTKQFIPFIY